jgi:hypothetical protein
MVMPIDGCRYKFEKLTSDILPTYYKALQAARLSAVDARIFEGHKSASRKLLGSLNRDKDFPGCYVFYEDGTARYVGISRTVVRRLTQRLSSGSAFSASLAYASAKEAHPIDGNPDTRMKDLEFAKVFNKMQDRLRSMRVTSIEMEDDPVTMYLFEVYAAMKLDTEWNHFRTH